MRALLLLVPILGCTPLTPPEAPEAPPSPETSHCADSCRQLQELGCKRGSDAVCASFDDATGECTATKSCVAACKDDPSAYPRDEIVECP